MHAVKPSAAAAVLPCWVAASLLQVAAVGCGIGLPARLLQLLL
jgi:hypothetical protein